MIGNQKKMNFQRFSAVLIDFGSKNIKKLEVLDAISDSEFFTMKILVDAHAKAYDQLRKVDRYYCRISGILLFEEVK